MTITTIAAFRLAVGLLAADGLIALWLTGLVGPTLAGLVMVAIIGSFWRSFWGSSWGSLWGRFWRDRLHGLGLRPVPARWVGLVAVAAFGVDLLYVAESLLDGFLRLLLFLLVYRLYTGASHREARDVGSLAFFMLVAAASVALDVTFLILLLGFVVLGVMALLLYHVLSEGHRADGQPSPQVQRDRVSPSMLALGAIASVATLAMATVFFVVIPRVGQATVPLRARLGGTVSGFADRVELGTLGVIATDASVVMRVRFPDGPPNPERLPNLRWRGLAFDSFDGHAWQLRRSLRRPLSRAAGNRFQLGHGGSGRRVTQEIFLEPIGADVIFAAPRARLLILAADLVTIDEMGSVWVPVPAARLRYLVESELETGRATGAPRIARGEVPPDVSRQPAVSPPRRAASGGDHSPLDRYLQVPPLSRRVHDLARRLTAGSTSDLESATTLTDFLSREYQYTLDLRRQTGLPPLEEFLFVRRAGHCEYFATALAVMLRSVGIRARVVNGFQRGEWNRYGRYFVVRQRDAHAWVEAEIDGLGWTSFDPSPRPEAAPPVDARWSLGLYVDAIRLRWYRYVINWSVHDQLAIVDGARRAASLLPTRIPRSLWRPSPGGLGLGLAVALGIGAIAYAAWRLRSGWVTERGPAMPWFYTEALGVLARRDLRPAPAETAREFLRRVADARPAARSPLERLTTAYEQVRFGGADPAAADRTTVQGLLMELAAAASGLGFSSERRPC